MCRNIQLFKSVLNKNIKNPFVKEGNICKTRTKLRSRSIHLCRQMHNPCRNTVIFNQIFTACLLEVQNGYRINNPFANLLSLALIQLYKYISHQFCSKVYVGVHLYFSCLFPAFHMPNNVWSPSENIYALKEDQASFLSFSLARREKFPRRSSGNFYSLAPQPSNRKKMFINRSWILQVWGLRKTFFIPSFSG
jgi:hypothetical protein